MSDKQYCRYCYGCIEGDCYYCTLHDKVLSEAYIKSPNRCKDYALSSLGDIITGARYKPRKPKPKPTEDTEQMRMEV